MQCYTICTKIKFENICSYSLTLYMKYSNFKHLIVYLWRIFRGSTKKMYIIKYKYHKIKKRKEDIKHKHKFYDRSQNILSSYITKIIKDF